MEKDQFKELLNKYVSGQASPEEDEFVQRLLDSHENAVGEPMLSEKEKEGVRLRTLANLMAHVPYRPEKRRVIYLYKWVTAAVVVLMVGAFAIYFVAGRKSPVPFAAKIKQPTRSNLHAGGNKAYLKLSDGAVVILDNADNGLVARQGETLITKAGDGKLQYVSGKNGISAALTFNTVSTPNGGTYQLRLPDGTRVWLNAASSLTFPTRFDSVSRHVKLTGEAYFEVAKQMITKRRHPGRLPFIVETGDSQVEVLGTHFNVSGYEDDAQRQITLLEGAVNVKHGGQLARIFPGEQALMRSGDSPILIRKANIDAVMAWKEGLFSFDNTSIPVVMKEIARWYNAKVIYKGAVPVTDFTGVLPRNSDIRSVLNWLELTHAVKFNLSGDAIIVEKTN